MLQRIFPDKRRKGFVLLEYTGYTVPGEAKRVWPKALITPRKPMYFKTFQEACKFRDIGFHTVVLLAKYRIEPEK